MAFSPDGRTLAYDGEGSVTLWEVASRRPRAAFGTGKLRPHRRLLFGKDARSLAVASREIAEVQVRDLAAGTVRYNLKLKPAEGVVALARSPDGNTLVGSGGGGTIWLWELATGKELASLRGKKDVSIDGLAAALAFSPDGKTVAVGGGNRSDDAFSEMLLWDVVGRRLVKTLGNFDGQVSYVSFSPDGKALTVGGYRDPIRTWRLPDLTLRSNWPSCLEGLCAVAYSPGGDFLVAAGGQAAKPDSDVATGEVRFLDAANGKLIHSVKSSHEFRRVEFSSDGRYLATLDNSLRVWDVSTLGRLATEGLPRPPRLPARLNSHEPALKGSLTPQEFEACWEGLAGDAPRAYQAICKLAGAPERAVDSLKGRLKPAAHGDLDRVARLVQDLHSGVYHVRASARQELEGLGDVAGPELRRSLLGNLSLECRRRVEQLLRKLNEVPSPERLRSLRAEEALELIGTPEAWRVLADLAKGAPEDRLTREARLSLWRLSRAE